MPSRFVPWLLVLLVFTVPAFGQSPESWQQEVAYEMDISLHADDHQYTGHQVLEYTNHSPDTLRTVYYHLYFNAFHPNSMMAERNRHLPDPDGRIVPRIWNLDEDEQGWHRVHRLTQDGTEVSFSVNDTVMRVDLAEPILPGETTTFEMNWRAQIPLQTRRSGRDSRGGEIDFSMTQWYPKMAEYDERGWHAVPYVGREFYAPFGTFDVELTLPAEYTVGGSGLLQNPETVGKGYDGAPTRTWRPSDGEVPQADSLTWHFIAENVHDFAWAADPDYVHDKVTDDGVTHHILYKPDVADSWERLKDDMPELTRFFNDRLGPYPYPQMTVAQGGDGGMEYPMITLVAGYDNPEFDRKDGPFSILGTTIHEFAHMWYYAALGSNESDYAWIDEGFTSYATEIGFAHITGRTPNHQPTSIVRLQKLGLYESFDTPADWFQTNTGYGVAAYPGGEMIVDMLGYVMGDGPRDAWLKRILRERTFQHPDPFDFELFAEQESGMMLDWYFWQFTESTRQVDYALTDLEQRPSGGEQEVTFTLERKGEAVLPQDVKLTLADGSTHWVNVPLLSMHGHKPVDENWTVTDPWPWVYPTRTVTVTVPSRVEKAEIDPEGRTPDVNRLNNTASFPMTTRFLKAPQSDWFNYQLGLRPLLGYAENFGFGGGLQARGTYMMGEHAVRGMVTLWPEVAFGDKPLSSANVDLVPLDFYFGPLPEVTGSDRTAVTTDDHSWFDGVDFEFRYTTPLDRIDPRASATLATEKHLGFMENTLSASVPLLSALDDGRMRATVGLRHQLNTTDRVYRFATIQGDTAVPEAVEQREGVTLQGTLAVNPFSQVNALSGFATLEGGSGMDRLALRVEVGGAFTSDPNRALQNTAPPTFPPLIGSIGLPGGASSTRVSLEATKTAPLGPFTGRADLQVGVGAKDLLFHKQFVLGGRSLEQQWRNDAYRQVSGAIERPVARSNVTAAGPAGPVAYLMANRTQTGQPVIGGFGLTGTGVVSGRLSLHATPFPQLNALSPLGVELFSGIGTVGAGDGFFGGVKGENLVADAGVGLSYDVSRISHLDRWIAQSDVLQNLTVISRFPFYASDPFLIERGQNEFDVRWQIGVQIR